MGFPAASEVAVSELIRRGYDRAKGLGHDGPEAVLADHRALLLEMSGAAPDTLPEPLEGCRCLILDPEVMALAYAEPAPDLARRALVTVLEGRAVLLASHPWLMRAVEAFQAQGRDVRVVTRWIASMTVMPRWIAPGPLPEGASALAPSWSASLSLATSAVAEGPVTLIIGPGAGAELAAGVVGVEVRVASLG